VLVVLLAIYEIFQARRRSSSILLNWLLIAGGIAVAGEVFRYAYYGELLPNTYYAKTGGSWLQWARGYTYVSDYARDHEGAGLILLVTVGALAASDARLRLIGVMTAAFIAGVIWVGGDGLAIYRFVVHIVPLVAILEAIFAGRLWRALVSTDSDRRWAGAAATIGIAMIIFLNGGIPRQNSYYIFYDFQQKTEIPRWTRVGQWLKENAKPGESLAAVPIGAVSYYSGLIAYDMLGLTDRHIARVEVKTMGKGWAGHEKHDGPYILSKRPNYLLVNNIDVTSGPRDMDLKPYFIQYEIPSILNRERDLYNDDTVTTRYRPRSEHLGGGDYFNFYELIPEEPPAEPGQ
jgi:hypothetical protein